MKIKVKTFFEHPLVLSAQILVLVYFMDFALMALLDHYEIDFGENENFIEPFFMAIISFPFLYYLILNPYLQSRKQYAALLLSKNEGLEQAVSKATKSLRASEERYTLATMGTREGLWDLNFDTNEIYFSSRFKELLGYSDDDFPNSIEAWLHHIHEEDKERFERLFHQAQTQNESTSYEIEYRMQHKGGHHIWVSNRWLSVLNTTHRVARFVGSQSDISDRKNVEMQLLHDSLHDSLTNLPNRSLLQDRLQQVILKLRRHPESGFMLFFIDLDNFKDVNDNLGHAAGDALLKEIATRILSALREEDTLARLGGDEFAILVPETLTDEQMDGFLTRLYSSVEQPFTLNQTELHPKLTMGIVKSDDTHSHQKPDDILLEADIALYHAKETTKGSYCYFNKSLSDNIQKNFALSMDLRTAIQDHKLILYYQPIVDAVDQRVIAFEALMRWHHPVHGWVSPSHFIPLAEENAMIHDLGQQAFEQVTRDISKFNDHFGHQDIVINVNLSARQLTRADLFDFIQNTLAKAHMAPRQLCIEITESTVMQNKDISKDFIKQLKEKGTVIAMDDFGTGYSSLGSLYEFPFDILKIDQSFLKGPQLNGTTRRMIDTMRTMADTLLMKTVIEGVETAEQLEQLLALDCRYIQGFLYAKPQPLEDILQTIDHPDFYNHKVSNLKSA